MTIKRQATAALFAPLARCRRRHGFGAFRRLGSRVGGFEVHGVSGLALTVTLQAETTAAQISAPALAARPTLHRYLCGSFCECFGKGKPKGAIRGYRRGIKRASPGCLREPVGVRWGLSGDASGACLGYTGALWGCSRDVAGKLRSISRGIDGAIVRNLPGSCRVWAGTSQECPRDSKRAPPRPHREPIGILCLHGLLALLFGD